MPHPLPKILAALLPVLSTSVCPGLRGLTPWILADFRATRCQHPIYLSGVKKNAFFVLQEYYRQ